MKQLLAILIFLFAATAVHAQVKKLPKDFTTKRKIAGTQNVKEGYEHATMELFITNTDGKGETLNFKSSVNIAKVQITFIDVAGLPHTTTYNAGTKTGFFYLESGAYNPGLQKGYTLNFYVLRNDKPIWTFTVGPKK
ncbi:hypothetical protein [Ferruginibacter sp.]|nr:hypothetical protein [Ferruginibacter sp.]